MKKLFLALGLVLAAFPARADIIWAVAGPYTGSAASIGLSQQSGTKQAVEDINAAGGINGQKITLKTYDDACDPEQAVAVANKIISDNMRFVLHGTCSAAALAALKTYGDENVLLLNPLSSNPRVTDEGGPDMFRAMYRDDYAAAALADEILKHYGKVKLAIIHDKSAYGQGIAEALRGRLNQKGFKEIFFEPYDPNNHDYSVLAARLKQAGADALFIGGYPVEEGMITRQLREAGSNAQIFTGGELADPDYWKVTGKTGEGALFIFPTDPREEAGARKVVEELQKTGAAADGFTFYAYAAAQVLAQAMAKAGTDPAKVAAEMHKDTFDTILGKWSFDAKGDVRDIRLVMYRWHDGRFEQSKEQK